MIRTLRVENGPKNSHILDFVHIFCLFINNPFSTSSGVASLKVLAT